jgi:hypothetical protein
MFWGIPTIAVSVSHDLIHWTLLNASWVVPDPKAQEISHGAVESFRRALLYFVWIITNEI